MHVVYVLVNDKDRVYLYVLIKEGFISILGHNIILGPRSILQTPER